MLSVNVVNICFGIVMLFILLRLIMKFIEIWKTRFDNKSPLIFKYGKFINKTFIDLFKKEQSMFQTLFIILSIYLSVITFINNQKQLIITEIALKTSIEQSKKSDSVSDLNIQLLNSLNTSSSGLLQSMNKASDTLLSNIEKLSKSISFFPSKIDSITQNLNKLNSVINEQKKLAEFEFNRLPDLKMENYWYDDKSMHFEVYNYGTISALVDNVSISIMNQFLCLHHVLINNTEAKPVPFQPTKFQIYSNDDDYLYVIYQNNMQRFYIDLQFENDCVDVLKIFEIDIDIQLTFKTLNNRSGNKVFHKTISLK